MIDKVVTVLFGTIAIMPIPARSPALESYRWLTDTIDSFNGTESRLQLRSAPRLRIDYSIPRNAALRARAFNNEQGGLRRPWGVPLWTQAQLVGAINTADTSIVVDTTTYDFRNASLAFIYQSADLYAVVEINTIGSAILNLANAVGVTFTGAYVMPLRVGYILGDVELQRNGYNDVGFMRFDIEDNAALSTSAPAQFLSNDIYYDELLMDGAIYSTNVNSREERADYELGVVDRVAPWLYRRQTQQVMRLLDNVAEAYTFRQWLQRRAGKYRAFWMPSFENDMRNATTGTLTTTLRWYRDSYDQWATDRVHIAIEDSAGNWYPRTLSGLTLFSSTILQGTLNATVNIAASSIRRICYLGLKRLASDTVDLQWIGNSVCKSNFGITELQP